MTSARVLLVDDDAELCRLVQARLAQQGFHVTWTTSADECLGVLTATEAEVVVTDLDMAGMNGLELCERIAAARPDVPVVVLTAFGSLDAAVGGIRARAYDFLTKPPDMKALVPVLERAVEHARLRAEVTRLRTAVAEDRGFGTLVGMSPVMQQLYDVLAQVAPSDASVLVTGESGTGKELVARALHKGGRRAGGPFIAVNCAAVPEALLESELFGHVRGAFTDARGARKGLFLQAHGGTLFLDEIGELPLTLQPKLLRALQERAIRPLGADAEIPCDVRVISATNANLEADVRDKRFREDLYFRLNVIHVELPPLRNRRTDVLLLAQHFLQTAATHAGKSIRGLSADAAEQLLGYRWPGNVRELQNCMERAVAFARYEDILVDDLPEKLRGRRAVPVLPSRPDQADLSSLGDVEQRHILYVLDAVQWNRSRAAEILGIDRKTLYRKLAQIER